MVDHMDMSKFIQVVVGGGLFALLVGFVVLACEAYGYITMRSGHIFMALAWLVAVLIIWSQILPGKPLKQRLIVILIVGILMLAIDLLLAKFASARESPDLQTVVERAVIEARSPGQASIITTLVIDSGDGGKVKYHLEVKNGEVPITITDIASQTPSFFGMECGPYIPKNLTPGESLAIPGEPIGQAFPVGKDTNLTVRIAYNADVKGIHKDFITNYRFFVTQPVKPQTIFPFSVSYDEGQKNVDQDSADVGAKFALPEATIFLVLPEARLEDGKPNIISADNGERRFLFNPATREVIFESKAQSGRVMRVEQSLRQTSQGQGLHLLTLLWTPDRALLKVDGIEKEVRDNRAKK